MFFLASFQVQRRWCASSCSPSTSSTCTLYLAGSQDTEWTPCGLHCAWQTAALNGPGWQWTPCGLQSTGYLQGAMRGSRPCFLHGSWRRPGVASSRSSSSQHNLGAMVPDAKAMPSLRPSVWSSWTQVTSTPSSRRREPTVFCEAAGAGIPAALPENARPAIAAPGAAFAGVSHHMLQSPPCGAACRAVGTTLCNTWCWQTRAHLCAQTQQRRREKSRRLLRLGCKGEGCTGATSQTKPFSAEQSSQLLPPLVPWHYHRPAPTDAGPPLLSPPTGTVP